MIANIPIAVGTLMLNFPILNRKKHHNPAVFLFLILKSE